MPLRRTAVVVAIELRNIGALRNARYGRLSDAAAAMFRSECVGAKSFNALKVPASLRMRLCAPLEKSGATVITAAVYSVKPSSFSIVPLALDSAMVSTFAETLFRGQGQELVRLIAECQMTVVVAQHIDTESCLPGSSRNRARPGGGHIILPGDRRTRRWSHSPNVMSVSEASGTVT